VCIDEKSKDFSKKDEECGDEVAIIKLDEEVAERQPNQAKTTLDDSTSKSLVFDQQKIDQKWSNRCGNATFAPRKRCRV
jgi:hypothetical protein